jgi:hypothetical protein
VNDKTRLRLKSDGTPSGTRIETEDGTLIKGVQSVVWSLPDVNGFARMQIEVLGVAAHVVGLVEEDEASMLKDPTAIPQLSDPQEAPEL